MMEMKARKCKFKPEFEIKQLQQRKPSEDMEPREGIKSLESKHDADLEFKGKT